MDHKDFYGHLIEFAPNRVWRTYPGGSVLDHWQGLSHPSDTHFPEDWIASATAAVNPVDRPAGEGISMALLGGEGVPFDRLMEADPGYFLGRNHTAAFGPKLQLLVKLLDSAVRLHFQAHPTAAFARQHGLGPSGKAEAYHILSIRPEVSDPYIYLGFQRPPDRTEFRRMIEQQELAAIEACFDPIPVKPGDSFFIPGGFPHAIGPGILMAEIMEPSDLAVRFEFEKAGYRLPERARFMGRGLDFCLDVFDYSPVSVADVRDRYTFSPVPLQSWGAQGRQFSLIGAETTDCFEVRLSRFEEPATRPSDGRPFVGIVTSGSGHMVTPSGSLHRQACQSFFHPAGLEAVELQPDQGGLEILECFPPRAPAGS